MVTKPAASQGAANPPYPTTPLQEKANPLQKPHPPLPAQQDPESSDEDWDKDDDWEDIAKPHPEKGKDESAHPASQLPASLRVGPPPGALKNKPSQNTLGLASQVSLPISIPAASQLSLPASQPAVSAYNSTTSFGNPSPDAQSQNPFIKTQITGEQPFIKKQTTGEQLFGTSQSSASWVQATVQEAVYDPGPAELPASRTPVDQFSRMNLTKEQRQEAQPPLIPVETEDLPGGRDRENSAASVAWNPGMDISFMDAMTSRGHRLPDESPRGPTRSWQEQQEWDKLQRERRELEAAQALERAKQAEQLRHAEEEWHRGEEMHRQQAEQRSHPSQQHPAQSLLDMDDLPPPPNPPPRPNQETTTNSNTPPRPQVPEFYSIKQARWYDVTCSKLRTSPILTQNDNGPCPLLALVNVLVLSTPESVTSGLVETLRTREQVSLNLLLEAVVDELMSGRRDAEDQEIPDVGELYDFLKGLHTGMNVNPQFTFTPDRASMEIHPAFRPKTSPGNFEETKEMRLYSTFNVPLYHGWVPRRDEPAYKAFYRSAKTYEDAQNIQFGEEELEHKLSVDSLTPQEMQLFEDLHTIKGFLVSYPTQLTPYGLDLLHEHVKPGTFAILFRNDHFSTLYKEPRANQLMTLVTDAGYASHDEIIWESLIDINGQGSEMFSGDFRPVSHSTTARASSSGPPAGPRGSSLASGGQNIQSMLDVGDAPSNDWPSLQDSSTVRRSRLSTGPQQTGVISSDPSRSKAEQEDHDLALALQMQEEEDARARREREARQRDTVLEGQGRVQDPRITIPINGPGGPPGPNNMGRRTSAQVPALAQLNTQQQQQGGLRPPGAGPVPPPRRNREDGDEIPPPTYEQAASRPAFVPPANHPASPNAPVRAQGQRPAASPLTYGPGRASGPARGGYMGGPAPGPGRGRGIGVYQGQPQDRDKCVIM